MDLSNWAPQKDMARKMHRAGVIAGKQNKNTTIIKLTPGRQTDQRFDYWSRQDEEEEEEEEEEEDWEGWCRVWGLAPIPPSAKGEPGLYRPTLLIVDQSKPGDPPLAQRMSALREFNDKGALIGKAEHGRKLLQNMHAVAQAHQANSRNDQKDHPIFHLGIWHQQGHAQRIWSADTMQNTGAAGTQPARKTAVDDFLAWARAYFTEWITPLIEKDERLDPEIKQQLARTKDGFEGLCFALSGARESLTPYYSMLSPFTTFSPKAHKDGQDTDFSILLNLGAQAWLNFPDYKASIHLQPYDVCIFRSNKVAHSTSPVQQDAEPAKRWSISFFQRRMVQRANEKGVEEHQASDPMHARGMNASQRVEEDAASQPRRRFGGNHGSGRGRGAGSGGSLGRS